MTVVEPSLRRVHVKDVMHTGILTTDPQTPLRTVAAMMAERHIHAVGVSTPDHARRPMAFVSAQDVVAAAAQDKDMTAGRASDTEVVAIPTDARVDEAAQKMLDHGVSHLIVVESASGHPCGIISALDIVGAYGVHANG
ncbi:MAG: CBS domain-containing protein [Solirubrobacterales bacterium]|nr:CBS domain-containing protein [Solirubrobacterales bacterium]